MDNVAYGGSALGRLLDAAEDASPVRAVEAVTSELRSALGGTAASFLIADLSGRSLVRLAHVTDADAANGADRREDEESAEELPFDGGPREQAIRSQAVRVLPPGQDEPCWTVYAPVTERGEALGLLEMLLPAEPGEDVLADIVATAHVLAFVVIANRRHTDLFEWGQRSTEFTLAAEIQRRLLPSAFTCEAGSFTLSAWLEPAAHVGGDTFDYSVGRDVLHLSVTDAMGHGAASALTATLCVGSLRNTRRQGATLLDQAGAANAALVEHTEGLEIEGFATGIVGRLDLTTGVLALVNAGHVAPYLCRGGRVTTVDLPAGLPLGLFGGERYEELPLALEPGDRLVFVTDGMLERRAAAIDLVAEITTTRELHPRETTRRLADAVLAATGPVLADDATLMVLDWHGANDTGRHTVAGAGRGGRRADPVSGAVRRGDVATPGGPPDDPFGFAAAERRVRERRRRAAVALALAVGGLVVHAALTRPGTGEYDPVTLAVTIAAPLLVLLTAGTPFGRWIAFVLALVFTPITLAMMLYGFWGVLVVAALWWTFAA